jgi:ABC-type transport system involved in multi-copper enzyme maturation permease subunit
VRHVPFSLTRTLLIAQNTLLEASRQKLFNFLLLLALSLVAGAQWFRDFNFGAPELKFLADLGYGAMAFFGAALTVAATAQLFFSEIENRTALTLLAKPVWRAEFILGKYLGVVAVAAVFCALLTGLLAGVLWAREGVLMGEFPDSFPQGRTLHLVDLAAAGFLQWLKLAVLAAFTLLVASFSQTQLYTVVTGFFVLVICHLQYLAQDAYARGGSTAAQIIAGLIGLMFPNFQLFNFADNVGAGVAVPWDRVARVSVYALGYVAGACALAVFSFRKREI